MATRRVDLLPAADGRYRGRIYRPTDGFRVRSNSSGWDGLMKDTRERNQAFFDKAGITGARFNAPPSGAARLDAEKISQTARNIAAMTGPMMKP